ISERQSERCPLCPPCFSNVPCRSSSQYPHRALWPCLPLPHCACPFIPSLCLSAPDTLRLVMPSCTFTLVSAPVFAPVSAQMSALPAAADCIPFCHGLIVVADAAPIAVRAMPAILLAVLADPCALPGQASASLAVSAASISGSGCAIPGS